MTDRLPPTSPRETLNKRLRNAPVWVLRVWLVLMVIPFAFIAMAKAFGEVIEEFLEARQAIKRIAEDDKARRRAGS